LLLPVIVSTVFYAAVGMGYSDPPAILRQCADLLGDLMNKSFELAGQLDRDCSQVGDFPLCRLLLSTDANYPWFILVPRRPDLTELCDLTEAEQHQFMAESSYLCEAMRRWFKPDKLNVAALGNVVPQLHVHHIARFRSDAAWPAPVWGVVPAKSYDGGMLNGILKQCQELVKFPGYQALPPS
jgi:diadenosine tetraphosphate (Ap4A) HIT family hydrolase